MKKLILILALSACGADPDDFKVEDSDGCKSGDTACSAAKLGTGTQAEVEEEKTTTAQVDEKSTTVNNKGTTINVDNEVSVNTTVVVDGNAQGPDNSANCEAGKLCRGMTKAEVMDLLGAPTIYKTTPETWEWDEFEDLVVCGKYYTPCTITFVGGKVSGQKYVSGEWIDLENF